MVQYLKTRTDVNAKMSVFVICVETIIYLLLYNLHDCTFKEKPTGKTCFSLEMKRFALRIYLAKFC